MLTQHFPTPQSPLVKLALKGPMFSVEALETSHPQLVHIVNPISMLLAHSGISAGAWPFLLGTFVVTPNRHPVSATVSEEGAYLPAA